MASAQESQEGNMDTTGGEISTEKESDVDPPEKKQDLCLESILI